MAVSAAGGSTGSGRGSGTSAGNGGRPTGGGYAYMGLYLQDEEHRNWLENFDVLYNN